MTTIFSVKAKRLARWPLALAAAAWLSSAAMAVPPRPAPRAQGLDGLDDSALAAELSGRGINNLLDYYFKANRVSQEQQGLIRTLGAFNDLRGPAADKIPYGEKVRRVRQVADGIDSILPTLRDPNDMMKMAAMLIQYGVNSDVNNIEYWGDDPVTRQNLLPLATAVVKLLGAASVAAQQQADALSAKLTGAVNDPNADRWEKLDVAAHTAAYTKNMSVYFQELALPMKERKALAEQAITYLSDFDNDSSGVQPRVRNMLAKLNMAAGAYKEARAIFATVYADNTEVKPPPNPFEQYEARYFTVVDDVLAQDLTAARGDKTSLDDWQTRIFPGLLQKMNVSAEAIAQTNKDVGAAAQMLQWRVDVLEGDLAKAPAAKAQADKAAETVLLALRQARPDLAARIDEQLVKRMPANKVIDGTMPPSLLLALMKKGLVESYKHDDEKPDPAVMNKGIEAAAALLNRADKAGVSPQDLDRAALAIPLLNDRMNKRLEAANGYLDYAVAYYKTNPKQATDALDRAGFLVFDLRRNPPTGFSDLYSKFLPIAIDPPYNHLDLAYAWAEQLRQLQHFPEALKYYRLVPANSPFYRKAAYKTMLVLDEMLDAKLDKAERDRVLAELIKSAERVRANGQESQDAIDRAEAAQATVRLADLARTEQNDPKRTLELLQGFEDLVKGLPAENELLRLVMIARINAYMAVGQTDQAVGQIRKLLESAKGDEGIALVRELLDKLEKEYVAAELNHDTPRMRGVTHNMALLTGYLVDWSNPATQKNQKVSQFYYKYAVYDARTQRLAGSLAADPAEQTALLKKAFDRYKFLDSREMKDLYLAQADVKKQIADGNLAPEDPDPQVATGLALTAFALGDYKLAAEKLSLLIGGKKLGSPEVTVIDPQTGEPRLKDNDLYWEAMVKYLKSAYEVAKAANDAAAKNATATSLKNLLIRGGIPLRWQEDYENLRKEIAPDYHPSGPATAPATQPVAVK